MSSTPSAERRVHVLFFSILREKVGTAEKDVVVDGSATGADLLHRLVEEHPEIEDHRDSIRLAVNEEYVSEDVTLRDGDEVALITPVSGG